MLKKPWQLITQIPILNQNELSHQPTIALFVRDIYYSKLGTVNWVQCIVPRKYIKYIVREAAKNLFLGLGLGLVAMGTFNLTLKKSYFSLVAHPFSSRPS